MKILRVSLAITMFFGCAQLCFAKKYSGPWGDVQSPSNDPWGETTVVPPSQPPLSFNQPPAVTGQIQTQTLPNPAPSTAITPIPTATPTPTPTVDDLQMLGLSESNTTPTDLTPTDLVPSANIPPMDQSIRQIQSCVDSASLRNNVPVGVIYGIMKTEGGHVGTVSHNTNGSDDLGVMQINNETWIPILEQQLGQSYGQVRNELIYNPCFNINVGTSVLELYYNQTSPNLDVGTRWITAVGWYNSHDGYYMHRYQRLFLHNFLSMFGSQVEQVAAR